MSHVNIRSILHLNVAISIERTRVLVAFSRTLIILLILILNRSKNVLTPDERNGRNNFILRHSKWNATRTNQRNSRVSREIK